MSRLDREEVFSERRLLHWSAEQVQSVPNENNRESATLVMQIQV